LSATERSYLDRIAANMKEVSDSTKSLNSLLSKPDFYNNRWLDDVFAIRTEHIYLLMGSRFCLGIFRPPPRLEAFHSRCGAASKNVNDAEVELQTALGELDEGLVAAANAKVQAAVGELSTVVDRWRHLLSKDVPTASPTRPPTKPVLPRVTPPPRAEPGPGAAPAVKKVTPEGGQTPTQAELPQEAALPDDYPSDIAPVPDGARVTDASSFTSGGSSTFAVTYLTKDDPDSVANFYKEETAKGWSEVGSFESGGEITISYQNEAQTGSLIIGITKSTDYEGYTQVNVVLTTGQ